MASSIQIKPLWLFPKIMVIRESWKLICKPLRQISSLGGTGRRGQNYPSIWWKRSLFFFNVGVCIIHRSPSKFNGRGHSDTSVGSAQLSLMWRHQKLQGTSRHSRITAKRRGGKAQKKGTPLPFPPLPWFLGPTLQVEFALSALQKDRTHRVQIVVAVTAQGASPSFCYLQRMEKREKGSLSPADRTQNTCSLLGKKMPHPAQTLLVFGTVASWKIRMNCGCFL